MKIALAPLNINNDPQINCTRIINSSISASSNGADLIVFPEDSITGLRNKNDPTHDYKLARSADDPIITKIKVSAKLNNINIAFGFLEFFDNKIYDSYVILDRSGDLKYLYRRRHPGWRWSGPNVAKDVYGEGETPAFFRLENINFSILVCGELFDDRLVSDVTQLKPDILLYPLLRCGMDEFNNEFTEYRERLSSTGAISLMVNGIRKDEDYFGGAWVINSNQEILEQRSFYDEALLFFNYKN